MDISFINMTSLNKIKKYFDTGFYNKAIRYFSELDETNPSPQVLNVVAACYFRLGEYHKADIVLQQAEPSLSDNPGYLSLYAANSRLLANYEKSRSLFIRALELDPTSLSVKNNYANLLIDEAELEEAETILTDILKVDPHYKDAISNLNRVRYKISSLQDSSKDVSIPTVVPQKGFSLVDPLLLAFADEEVDYARKRYKLKNEPDVSRILDNLPGDNVEKTNQDKLAVARQSLSEGNFKFCLQICNSISPSFVNAEIYDIASDAYLNLRRFKESEICLLNSLVIGGGTPKRYLNLVTFSSMRSDFSLAEYYLEKAASLDPSHPQLDAISKLVKKQKTNSTSHSPFSESWQEPDLKK